MITTAYVGNRGVHLHDGNLAFNEPDSATFLKLMNSNQEWSWVSDPASAAAAGVNYPYAGVPFRVMRAERTEMVVVVLHPADHRVIHLR